MFALGSIDRFENTQSSWATIASQCEYLKCNGAPKRPDQGSDTFLCHVGGEAAGRFSWQFSGCLIWVFCDLHRVDDVDRLAKSHGVELGGVFHRVSDHFLEIQKQLAQISDGVAVALETSYGNRLIEPVYCTPKNGGSLYYHQLKDPQIFEEGLAFINHKDISSIQPTEIKIPRDDTGS